LNAGLRPPIFVSMIDDLYSGRILALAANMPRAGRLEMSPPLGFWMGTGEQVAKLCGSKAVVDIKLDIWGTTVLDFAQDVKACALGQAAAAVLGGAIVGGSVAEVRQARREMAAMLKEGGDGPTGRFEDLRALKIVAEYPARHASTLVALDATIKAIDNALEYWEVPCILAVEGRIGSPADDDDRTRRAG
jgi:NifU-like protein involved in Fe-S cluster formation